MGKILEKEKNNLDEDMVPEYMSTYVWTGSSPGVGCKLSVLQRFF